MKTMENSWQVRDRVVEIIIAELDYEALSHKECRKKSRLLIATSFVED